MRLAWARLGLVRPGQARQNKVKAEQFMIAQARFRWFRLVQHNSVDHMLGSFGLCSIMLLDSQLSLLM